MTRLHRFLPLLYVLLLAGLLIGPLWTLPGIPNSADGILHLHRTAAVARSFAQGEFWPRWLPDVYQGLGAPTLHYYSPLFYLSVAFIHRLGLPLDVSAKVLISGLLVLSGLATYAWLRRLFGRFAALAGVPLYLGQAFLFREYYVQGDYPQMVAVFLLPVVMWAFTRLYLDDGYRSGRSYRLLAPLSLAAMIVAHNITAMIGAGVLVLYGLGMALSQPRGAAWLRLVGAAALGLGLSAFFWLPSVADMGLVQADNLTQGMFDYRQNFVPTRDLLAAPPLLDSRAANPPFPHLLGWAAWLALAVGVVTLVARRAGRAWLAIGLGIAAVCVALTQQWTAPLWEWVPLFPLVLFPSRFLGPAALGVALTAAASTAAYREKARLPLALGSLLAVALTASVFLFPSGPFLSMPALSVADTHAYERRAQVWGLTSASPFLPRGAQMPGDGAGLIAQADLPDGAQWTWSTPHRAALRPAAGAQLPAGTLVLPAYYFPAWRATVDGAVQPIEPADDGRIALELAAPAGEVALRWVGTAWQRVGAWISRGALLLVLAWVVWQARRGKPGEEGGTPNGRSWDKRWLAPLVLLLVLILARAGIHQWAPSLFQLHSPPDRVIGVAHPMNETLGGEGQPEVTLLGWDLLPGSRQAGATLRLRLYWQVPEPIDESLHSFLHLYTPAQKKSWAGVQNWNPGHISTRVWKRILYYVDELTLELPEDLPPTAYTLAIGLVDDDGHRLAVAGNPDGLLFLDEVTITPTRSGLFPSARPSVAARAEFGSGLRLQGYDLLPDPGGPILRLFWEVARTPGTDLKTFVHLVDEQGALAAQFDSLPLQGMLSTTQWPAGARLIDRQKLALPEDLPSGPYRLLVGLYDPETSVRLEVRPGGGNAEHFQPDALVIPFVVP